MYLSHFGLHESPFRITPDTDFFFSGANRGATLDALLYAILHDEGIVKVTGEVGSGKTMLCRVLSERLPKTVETIYLANPSLSRDEILYVIAADLEVEAKGSRTTILLRALQEKLIGVFAAGRRVVVLIDEAHAMPMETLEEVRLLSNLESNRHKLLQIVLFGQPELDLHLGAAKMRQLKERVVHSFRLEPLVRSDIESYVDFRMRAAGYRGPNVFSSRAMRMIARTSHGLTRRVNILCDKALLAAFADASHQVLPKHARAAIRDSEFDRRQPISPKWWLAFAGLVAGLALGIGWHFISAPGVPLAGRASESPPAAPTAPPLSGALSPAPAPAAPPSAPAGGAASPAATTIAARDTNPGTEPASPDARAASPVASAAAGPTRDAPTSPDTPPAAVASPLALGTPPASGKLAQERFVATQRWLATAPRDHYSIQLATMGPPELADLERLLRQSSELLNPNELFVYSQKIGGQQYYRVAYGDFPSAEAAAKAIETLPAALKPRRPYERSVEFMRAQNQL